MKKPILRFSGTTRIHLKYLIISYKLICINPIWPLMNEKWLYLSNQISFFLIMKICIFRSLGAKTHLKMSFNTIISLDICIISAWENTNLHKSNMTLDSSQGICHVSILLTSDLKNILKPLPIANCQEKVANTIRHNSE